VLGVILLGVFAMNYVPAPGSYLVAIIGLILLVTGIVGTCGLYSVLGTTTLEKKPDTSFLFCPAIARGRVSGERCPSDFPGATGKYRGY
jgi:hypothetical protein